MGRDPMRWHVARHWRSIEPDFVLEIDLPRCFACGYDNWSALPATSDPVLIRQRWEKAGFLECAHIIAATAGGFRAADNLLLLCKRCHVASPMLNSRDLMLEWVRNRPYIVEDWIKELRASLGTIPVNINCAGLVPFLRYLQADRHPRLPHGSIPSSYIMAAREYAALHRAGFVYQPPRRPNT